MKSLKFLGFIFALVTGAANAEVVDLDARLGLAGALSDVSGQTITLNAGTYTVQAVQGKWNAWGDNIVEGCDSGGFGCSKGWLSSFNIESLDIGNIQVGSNNNRFSSGELALANAPSFQFTINGSQDITFYISDNNHRDNVGGLSVSVSPVPEASTIALLSAGLGFVSFVARRKNRK